MKPEWEDIEPWQDPRWDFIASGFIRRYNLDSTNIDAKAWAEQLRRELDNWGDTAV